MGTPRAITRPSDNAVVWKWENSDPFGANLPNENPSGLGAFAFNLRFPGQYYDQEMGTHYNYFRDYDPATGRYVQSDPIGLIAGLNTFAYVDGNPISGLDFFGLANGGGQMPSPFPILRRTYIEMKDKNMPGTDQFFHCLAACRAVKEGFTAKRVLDWMDLKENRDAALKTIGDRPRLFSGDNGGLSPIGALTESAAKKKTIRLLESVA